MAAAAPAISPEKFLGLGLEVFNYKRWRSYKHGANLIRFKKHYGVLPITCCQVWQKLRLHTNPESRLSSKADPRYFLMAVCFLWSYQTEAPLASQFGMSEKTSRKWVRYFVERIGSLLPSIMGTLDDNDVGLNYMLTVDGTHCPIEEPRPFTTEWSSHKRGGKPAINYELGISIHRPKLVWCYGGTRPGKTNDLGVFHEALGPALFQLGKRAIGDGIYSSATHVISSKNELDPAEVAIFKNRALARHEKYNGLLKNFKVLSTNFRHKDQSEDNDIIKLHRTHFHAVAVFVQTQLDNGGFTLFDAYP